MIKFIPQLIKGRTVTRHKRFTVKVQLPNKQVVDTYCPNTGPMTGVWQENRPCWIQPRSGNGKLLYVMRLMETDNALVGIDTHLPNLIVNQALTNKKPEWFIRLLPEFQSFESEIKLKPSWRVDFLLKSHGKTIPLEVKNVLWQPHESLAAFPDTITTRGQKHIHNLAQFAKENNNTSIVLYVIQRSDCTKFAISQNKDPQYWQLWQHNPYVKALAVSCQVHSTHIELHESVPYVETISV